MSRAHPLTRSTVIRLLCLVALVAGLLPAFASPAEAHGFKALVFSKTAGFRHDSIPAAVSAIQQMGADHDFEVDATEDATAFTDENLAQYDVVIWALTTGDVLNAEQQAAFERYVQAGGGYVGVHAAADTEYEWPWYGELVGAFFQGHPRNQTATVRVNDRDHPSTAHLPARWERFDEWYSYRTNPRGNTHVLAALDEGTYDPEADPMGSDHPISWCQNYDGGRSWYTGMGHTIESYSEPQFLQHLLNGIETAAGVVPADCGGTEWGNFDKVALDTGTLNPMELAVAPGGRRVFYIERSGEVRFVDQETSQTTVAASLDVFTGREDGLLGIALDPDFATNGWVYLYYSATGEEEQRLSRFTMTGDSLDLSSEQQLLEVPVNREESGHAGGSMTFDPQGNLYVATGDDTNPFASDGYTPIDERDGRLPFDAQRSAGNTNDLRGKVLRIHPEDDGTYTVPDGNLFAPGTADTRPEVYAMGFRNPFRISYDVQRQAVLVADYGPDANDPDPDRGPEGRVEWNLVTEPGNFGWPYCHGSAPYHDYDFATSTSGPEFDCANVTNDSPNNTGLAPLPPVVPPTTWYGRHVNPDWPEFGTGGAPMAGPTYQYDPDLASDRKWPKYYDGTPIFMEWGNNELFELKLAGNDLYDVNPLLGSFEWKRPMDAAFGPDGALYVVEWGTGFSGANTDSGLYRIDYTGGDARPKAKISADPTSGPAPLEVAFSSEGSVHPGGQTLTYEWAFGDGGTSTEPNPAHTYTEAGNYTARLTVTDEDGQTSAASTEITVGNSEPQVTLETPEDGGTFDFGDEIGYRVTVDDPEDGSSGAGEIDCSRVEVQLSLGHNTHAHPVEVVNGCEGTFSAPADNGHPVSEELFWVAEASYTDDGGSGVGALTGRDLHRLQPKHRQAEHFAAQSGIETEPTADYKGGGLNIGFIDHGDWVRYERTNLVGVDEIGFRVASGGLGGTIEVRVDAPDGPKVGEATVEPTGGWQSWTDVTAPVTDPGGVHDLYLVFTRNAGDGGLFNMNYLDFRGKGVSENARPIVDASADPVEGEEPLDVTFAGDVRDPEGENVTYEWDFDDGSTGQGANVTHTYADSGRYVATLTATDASGASATDKVLVNVVPEPSPPIECDDPSRDPDEDDEFDGDVLDGCRWDSVVRPDYNTTRLEGGNLEIDTTGTNLFDESNNAPNLILQEFPEGDWVVETKVTGDVCEKWQQGGILVYDSDQTFLKFDYLGTANPGAPCSRGIEMRHEIDEVFQPDFPGADVTEQGETTWWLRLEKSGSTFTGSYSADGESFTALDPIENDRLDGAKVGLFGFGQEQTQSVTVHFDYFHRLDDPADACPNGYGDDITVAFGEADSGVTNHDSGDGCTMLDLIEAEAPFATKGAFVEAVERVTTRFVDDGVITEEEQEAVVAAAGRSKSWRPNRAR
jgi:cytochrome c